MSLATKPASVDVECLGDTCERPGISSHASIVGIGSHEKCQHVCYSVTIGGKADLVFKDRP